MKQESISTIHEAGGHLVLCKPDKRPCWLGWQKQRPALDVAVQHDGLLGLIPYSLGTSALDVDSGDWRRLPLPWVDYRTRRKGGRHLFYADAQARGNSTWTAEDCAGEVRGARGYVIPWHDGWDRLADAIVGPRQLDLFPFPSELIQDHIEPGRLIQFPERPLNPSRSLHLERVQVGARNDSLFDVVRKCAYRELTDYRKEGGNLDGWLKLVHDFTDDHNRRFSVPLKRDEVRTVAYSIATWVWSWGYDHSQTMQSKRGLKSGAARRAQTHERDKAIIQAVSMGQSLRTVGREFGLSAEGVRWILSRGVK